MNRTGGNKNKKRTALVLCLAAVLAACTWTGIQYAARKAVLEEVRHIAGESATVQAGRIGFNPLRRSVRIRNLHIATDSSRTKESRTDIKHMAVHIRRIDLDGLRRTKKEGGQSVSVGSITLKRPDVSIVLADRGAASARPAKRENTAGTIDIGRFVLQDGTFEICRTTEERRAAGPRASRSKRAASDWTSRPPTRKRSPARPSRSRCGAWSIPSAEAP